MIEEQYENWKDFALRMAESCFKHRRRPTWQTIRADVSFFFECLDAEDIQCIQNWDNSDPYPAESRHYCRTYRTSCWQCHGPPKQADCRWNCEDGYIYDYASPYCVGDMCTEDGQHWNPYYWCDLSEAEYEKRDRQFCSPVRCCIRAGLDMAVAPSGGVLGFTAGELRKMYPEGVPDWVTGGPERRWSYWLKDELNGTFAEMPDAAALML